MYFYWCWQTTGCTKVQNTVIGTVSESLYEIIWNEPFEFWKFKIMVQQVYAMSSILLDSGNRTEYSSPSMDRSFSHFLELAKEKYLQEIYPLKIIIMIIIYKLDFKATPHHWQLTQVQIFIELFPISTFIGDLQQSATQHMAGLAHSRP